MKVVATSDLHGYLPEIPECDILIVAGDVCPLDDHKVEYQKEWLRGPFNDWLWSLDVGSVVGIGGNHDFALEKSDFGHEITGWLYLQDEEIVVDGVRIYGSPWVPNLPLWAFHKKRYGLQEVHEQIPEGIDILVTHGPPAGVGDQIRWSGHIGDDTLNPVLYRVQPTLHVFGHIHEGFGVYPFEDANMMLANVAIKDENYDVARAPVVFEFEWKLQLKLGANDGNGREEHIREEEKVEGQDSPA